MSLKDSLEKINEECAEKIVELQRKELDLIVNHELEELASIEVEVDRIIKIIKKNNDLIKELTPGPINITTIRGNEDFIKAPDLSRSPIGGVTINPVKSEPTSASPFTREFKYTTVTNECGNIKEPDWSNTHCESCNISATSAPPLNQDEFISVCDDSTKEVVNKIECQNIPVINQHSIDGERPKANASGQKVVTSLNSSDIERAVERCALYNEQKFAKIDKSKHNIVD